MEGENKRTKWLSFILIMVVITSAGFFIWNFIDRGTINFVGETPFIIEDYKGMRYVCDQSPCEIKMRTGYKYLDFYKDGYDSFEETIKLEIFDKIDLQVDFAIIAAVTTAESLPVVDSTTYEIVFEDTNTQKLVDSEDIGERAIVYFQKIIDNPIVISSDDYVFIIDDKGSNSDFYKVDIRSKSRSSIDNEGLNTMQDGKFSLDGRYLVYKKDNSEYLWILDTKENDAKELLLSTDLNNVDWDYLNRLIFVTAQSSAANTSSEYAGDMLVSSTISEDSFLFGYYIEEDNAYYNILTYNGISSAPSDLVITKNGKIIYFATDEKYFQIILDKI